MRRAWRTIDGSVASESSSIGGSVGRALAAARPTEPNAVADGLVGESTAEATLLLGGDEKKDERLGDVDACGDGGATVRTRGDVPAGSTGVRSGGE